jgi:hypothetical protein
VDAELTVTRYIVGVSPSVLQKTFDGQAGDPKPTADSMYGQRELASLDGSVGRGSVDVEHSGDLPNTEERLATETLDPIAFRHGYFTRASCCGPRSRHDGRSRTLAGRRWPYTTRPWSRRSSRIESIGARDR